MHTYILLLSLFNQCMHVVESFNVQSRQIALLIKEGCYEYDAYTGWQTVIPCPAHVICGRINSKPLSHTGPSPHCPTDFHFKVPEALNKLDQAPFAAEQLDPVLSFAAKVVRPTI